MHRNVSGRKQVQFYQGQCAVVRVSETQACQIRKYPDNLKNICQIKLVLWYHINAMDMVDFRLVT